MTHQKTLDLFTALTLRIYGARYEQLQELTNFHELEPCQTWRQTLVTPQLKLNHDMFINRHLIHDFYTHVSAFSVFYLLYRSTPEGTTLIIL